jgi:hypothetical protein
VFACVLAVASLGAGSAPAKPPTKSECIAFNEDAQDLEREGKLRDARTKLAVCVAATCPGAVREDCAERLSRMEVRIPSLVFDVKDAAGNDVTGVRVRVDGELLPNELNGTPIEFDPGRHQLAFEAQGLAPVQRTLIVTEGEQGRRVHVEMVAPSAAAPAASPSAPAVPTGPPAGPLGSDPLGSGPSGFGLRTASLVLLGAGAAGIGVGAVFGLMTKWTYQNALENECHNDPTMCTPKGATEGQTAQTQAVISTVAFIAGGALAAAGAILYVAAPKKAVAVGGNIGPGVARLELVGRW